MSDTGEANRARERGAAARGRESTDQERPALGAASVSRRWWEETARAESLPLFTPARSEPAARPAGVAPPPPPPPPPRWTSVPPASRTAADPAHVARIRRLEQELAAARDEATALHEMLEDLPEIFERKFRQRLHGILEQQQLLLADNRLLREQLFALQPAPAEPEAKSSRLLPPAPDAEHGSEAGPEPLRRVLHGMRRLGRRLRSTRLGGWSDDAEVSDRDGGQPRAGSAAPRHK